jgi:dihydroneopterin triphosphate diphosphatase
MSTEKRSPYQILVIPFYKQKDGNVLYALFKREDMKVWQGIAGGGEKGESPIETARREASEEANISPKSKMIQLSSVASIPVVAISGFLWGEDVLVIPEHSFGVKINQQKIKLSKEHLKYQWFTYDDAMEKLNWDSNKTALWELNYRIETNKLEKIKTLR